MQKLRADVGRYLEFRAAAFNSWHPKERQLLISTRFADATQLHLVKKPGGARRQLTFLPEPVAGGGFRPKTGEFIVFAQDKGGGEFYQLYRYDVADGRITLLTDGKSRNTGGAWSDSGKWMAYSSTRRTGKDTDIYVMDPANPKTDRLVLRVEGGGWSVSDWSPDESRLLVTEYLSINESQLWFVDVKTGVKTPFTARSGDPVAYSDARFSRDGKAVYAASDHGSEFRRLVRLDIETGKETVLSKDIPWDVENFDLSPDGKIIAFVSNEDGASRLHIHSTKGRPQRRQNILALPECRPDRIGLWGSSYSGGHGHGYDE